MRGYGGEQRLGACSYDVMRDWGVSYRLETYVVRGEVAMEAIS